MKTRSQIAALTLTTVLAGTAVAQVPPELLGLGNSTLEAIDTSKLQAPSGGGWADIGQGNSEGLGCVVSFISTTSNDEIGDTFGLIGPATKEHAEKGIGLVVFTGRRIPPSTQDGALQRITILSDEAPNTTRAMHYSNGEMNVFMVPVQINAMLEASNPEESIGIVFNGAEVYRVNITSYNEGRVKLRDCMRG
ncbi:hypothetical protein [Silanimonas sp.]|jgi:hypothetical protein|uniref:hypothetical protein n=1 Tax=Silanimonas sp. TaxID=1929290 RepID=UPI0022C41F3E|nr:hypothetical protein [Silanimonas sp.]MCZ8164654.1 hypothetical protein [Silanimonas sp.]